MTSRQNLLVIASVLVLDRITKLWALKTLAFRPPIEVLPFFHLTYVENTGAAFGMGQDLNWFFVGLSSAILAVLLYWRRSWSKENIPLQLGCSLVAGGAVGNLCDRIAYGYVIDFLDFLVWPVFNVADSCITVGAFLLFLGFRSHPPAAVSANHS